MAKSNRPLPTAAQSTFLFSGGRSCGCGMLSASTHTHPRDEVMSLTKVPSERSYAHFLSSFRFYLLSPSAAFIHLHLEESVHVGEGVRVLNVCTFIVLCRR